MSDGGYELREELPYPSLEGIKENKSAVKIIAPAYGGDEGEITAVLQYGFQERIFKNLGLKEYAEVIEAISIAEMRHVEILGEIILKLGVLPIYTSIPPCSFGFYSARKVSTACTPEKMILDDIAAEQAAIIAYTDMIKQLCDEDVAAVIQRIRMDEEAHLRTFKRIYAELTETCELPH